MRTAAHPVLIVVNIKAFMSPDVQSVPVLCLLGGRAHKAPNWELIDEQLIPGRESRVSFGQPDVSAKVDCALCRRVLT